MALIVAVFIAVFLYRRIYSLTEHCITLQHDIADDNMYFQREYKKSTWRIIESMARYIAIESVRYATEQPPAERKPDAYDAMAKIVLESFGERKSGE